jgi:hypothetical protein
VRPGVSAWTGCLRCSSGGSAGRCLAQVPGPHRTAGVGEGAEDLLVGRVVRHVGAGRLLDGLGSRDGEEGLAGDAQVLALRVELAEAGGEVLDARAELSGLFGQFALAGLAVGQDGADLRVVADAALQEGRVAPVRRRAMTEVIAQKTREQEVAGRCS